MPVPLVVFACKASAGGGLAAAVLDFAYQVAVKKLLPEAEKKEPICGKAMIQAFAAGVVVGNVAGATAYGVHRHLSWHKILVAMASAETVWVPLHVTFLLNKGRAIEHQVPQLFGYCIYGTAGLAFLGRVLHMTGALSPTNMRSLGHIRTIVADVGGQTTAALLFIFANKYADSQRNKTVLNHSPGIAGIHWCAVNVGQLVATMVSFDIAATAWCHMPGWWEGSMIVFPAFIYCACLNIEAGVSSAEVDGRPLPTAEAKLSEQVRRSALQVIPLGTLPTTILAHRSLPAGVVIGFQVFAALCAGSYVALQQRPWSLMLRAEQGDVRKLSRDGTDTAWGAEWEEADGQLKLKSVADGSPSAEALSDMVGRTLEMCNDAHVESADDWQKTAEEVLVLNLDFARDDEPEVKAETEKDKPQEPADAEQ
eukprot:TRINITY_DN70648_c0_g1_i1.p1 TRINITY_DN70648_c0_g1~~TRINITY_DN70648_c0_g1_i1.p1  ORF type:complete len:452 (+),score=133.07 TRINITY_DN70648_c0_g1_i1:86-1357(+)